MLAIRYLNDLSSFTEAYRVEDDKQQLHTYMYAHIHKHKVYKMFFFFKKPFHVCGVGESL